MHTWTWCEPLRACFDFLEIQWEMVPEHTLFGAGLLRENEVRRHPAYRDKDFTSFLGSSPGDILWAGDRFIIEETCPDEWVAHDLAHLLVCWVDYPNWIDARNFGFDFTRQNVTTRKVEIPGTGLSDVEVECLASDLTIGLLSVLGLPTQWARVEMSCSDVTDEECRERSVPYLKLIEPVVTGICGGGLRDHEA